MTRKKMISMKRNYAEVPKHDFNITVIGEMDANVGHVHSGLRMLWENRHEKKEWQCRESRGLPIRLQLDRGRATVPIRGHTYSH